MSSLLLKWQYKSLLNKVCHLKNARLTVPISLIRSRKRDLSFSVRQCQITSTPVDEITNDFPHIKTHEDLHKFSVEQVSQYI